MTTDKPSAADRLEAQCHEALQRTRDISRASQQHGARFAANEDTSLRLERQIQLLRHQLTKTTDLCGNVLARLEVTEQAVQELQQLCGVVREPNVPPPLHVEGDAFCRGVHDELDEMRDRG